MKSFLQYITEVEDWNEQITADEHGNQYRVKDLYDYAKSCKDCYHAEFPIKQTDALHWWEKHYSMDNPEDAERMKRADTAFPVLGVRIPDSDTVSVADGLNRIKKAHTLEGKTAVPAYIINMDKVAHLAIRPNGNPD